MGVYGTLTNIAHAITPMSIQKAGMMSRALLWSRVYRLGEREVRGGCLSRKGVR